MVHAISRDVWSESAKALRARRLRRQEAESKLRRVPPEQRDNPSAHLPEWEFSMPDEDRSFKLYPSICPACGHNVNLKKRVIHQKYGWVFEWRIRCSGLSCENASSEHWRSYQRLELLRAWKAYCILAKI